MEVLNFTEFRKNLAKSLNKVNDDADVVVVNRGKGKNVVIISLDEYNSWQETAYLNKSNANRKRLENAIKRMDEGKFETHSLSQD